LFKSKVSSAIKTLTITTTDTTPILKDSGSDDSYYKSNELDNGKQEQRQNHSVDDYSQIEQKGTAYDNKAKQLTIGFLVGLAAGYFGIGGGFIIVPSLMHLGLNIIDAIGTSLIPVSMFGFSTAIRYSI
jgi:Sulfite exporter TauE/SafE